MLLISQNDLDNYNINSYERAIVFSVLLLAGGDLIDNYNNNNIIISENININELPIKSVLSIKVKLPFKKEESFRSFGGFIKNIQEINLSPPYPLLIDKNEIFPWEYSGYPLPSTPPWIATVEEYLFWLVLTYQNKLIVNKENNFSFISIKNDFKTFLDIEIYIPFQYEKQLLFQNYLLSIYPIYLWGKPLTNINNKSIIDNTSHINNLFIVGNI